MDVTVHAVSVSPDGELHVLDTLPGAWQSVAFVGSFS